MNVNYSATNEQCCEKRHDDGGVTDKKFAVFRYMQREQHNSEQMQRTKKTNEIRTGKQSEKEKKMNVKPYKTVFICKDDDGDDATTLSTLQCSCTSTLTHEK